MKLRRGAYVTEVQATDIKNIFAVIALLEAQVVSLEGLARMGHGGFVDIDARHAMEEVRQVVVDNAVGASNIEKAQFGQVAGLGKILTNPDDGGSFFEAPVTVEQ